jgi:hypothetical protein
MENELAILSTKAKDHISFIENSNKIPEINHEENEGFPLKEVSIVGFTDVHVHIENMNSKKWRVPESSEVSKYFKDKDIVEAGVIFEDKKSVNTLRVELDKDETECNVVPFYFIHDPKDIDYEELERLYYRGLIKGIKLHPVYDNYPITFEMLGDVLDISKEHMSSPLLIHLDDRRESMHLTSPERLDRFVDEMIENDSITPIILGHSGAYAHPRLVSYEQGSNPPVESYWKKFSKEVSPQYSRLYLIKHALQLALEYPFIYLDTSTCLNKIKAKLMVDAINSNPTLAKKIILGTDFPVKSQYKLIKDGSTSFQVGATVKGQLHTLWNQGLKKEHLIQIASNKLYD